MLFFFLHVRRGLFAVALLCCMQGPDVDASVDVPGVSGDVSVAAPDVSLPGVSGEASLPSVGGDLSAPPVRSTDRASILTLWSRFCRADITDLHELGQPSHCQSGGLAVPRSVLRLGCYFLTRC